MRIRLFAPVALIVVLAGALGCGSSDKPARPDMGGEDGLQVAALVEELNDAKGDAKKTGALFAKGAAGDAKKLAGFDYSVVGRPSVSGTEATCKVRLDPSKGGEPVEKEWGFVKEGDKWKIKSAPLP